jgi:hypothetical protein
MGPVSVSEDSGLETRLFSLVVSFSPYGHLLGQYLKIDCDQFISCPYQFSIENHPVIRR